MNVVYVYASFATWGGVERIMIDKMNYLARLEGCHVYAITYDQGDHSMPYELDSSVSHFDLKVRTHAKYQYWGLRRLWEGWRRSRCLHRRLGYALSQLSPDVIVTTTSGELSILLKLKGKTPLIVESHGGYGHLIDYSAMTLAHRWDIRCRYQLIRKADVIVSLTESDASRWRKEYLQVKVIPNIVHLNPTCNYSDASSKRIIFVGRLAKQKDIPSLLAVWKIVFNRYSDWQLDVYGEGEFAELCRSIDGIVVHSPTSNIFTCYCESSILLLTSYWEPFGLVIPEAMSCGLPIVSFEGDGPCEIINNGVDGFIIKDRNIDEFAEKVCELIENVELRQKMGKNAIQKAQRYSADRIVPMWKKLFDSFTSVRLKSSER